MVIRSYFCVIQQNFEALDVLNLHLHPSVVNNIEMLLYVKINFFNMDQTCPLFDNVCPFHHETTKYSLANLIIN